MRGVLSKSNGNHYLLDVLLDVADSITYSRDLLGLIVGNSDLELLFKFHDELYSVESQHRGRWRSLLRSLLQLHQRSICHR